MVTGIYERMPIRDALSTAVPPTWEEGDDAALSVTPNGILRVTDIPSGSGTVQYASIAVSSSGANQIVAAVTGKKIRLLQYVIVANGTVNAKWQSGSTDKSGLLYLVVNSGVSSAYVPGGLLETASGEALNLNLSGAVAVGGHAAYVEV